MNENEKTFIAKARDAIRRYEETSRTASLEAAAVYALLAIAETLTDEAQRPAPATWTGNDDDDLFA